MSTHASPLRMATGWNFRHMVNLWRIRMCNAVNRRMGYPQVDMRSPKELVNEEW